MGLGWMPNPMTGVLRRREDGYGKTEAETRVLQLQVSDQCNSLREPKLKEKITYHIN